MPRPLRPVTPVGILAARIERAIELAEELDGCVATGEGSAASVSRLAVTAGALLEELRSAGALASGLEPYVAAHTTPESAALAAISARTEAHDWEQNGPAGSTATLEAEMLSGHVEGQLLKFLVAMTGARRVLEIGMFTGYSALAIAEALGDGGRVVACEIDPEVAAFAQRGFDATPDGARIEIRVGPAAATLAALAATAGYLGYLHAVLDGGLLTEEGTICVDNTLLQGEPWREPSRSANGAAIAAFNAAVAADPRVEQVLVPLRDGITLIRRAR
jgi:caffeoyl-CoA O-methyltransferase